ncbi:sensor histidine kinase [Methylobacter tundripaludum]|uniref:sensor histidine kinase n=1 Tax=Methylobacter tundripaludum TaxID=173365 RepID=UPI0004DF9440|nr:HAMP domain-containing sensor histidine kinase [Methylobacter tundripaludum]
MKLPSIVDTTSFKLSALYLGLFLVSFLAIGLTVYWLTTHTLEQQLKSSIETEANRLKAEYDSGGIAELKDEIDEVDGRVSHTLLEYGVIDQNGKLIAGNLNSFKPSAGWQTVKRTPTVNKPEKEGKEFLYIRVIRLPDNVWLGVGHDGEYIQDAGEAIIQAFLWGIVMVIVLGTGGGFYLSRAFLKKIEGITSSTEVIIAGDLKHRLPVAKNRDELDNLALLLNLMLDKIGALIENVQQVSNDIAHDLRTPISRLQFRLEDAVKRDVSAAQYREQIAFAIEEIDTILATFSALLRISQIESGSRRSGFKTVNLSDIVVSVAEALAPVAEEQGKTIHSAIDKAIELTGDKELLTQLAFNLLDNAIVHTPENTLIDLSLHLSDHRIELRVADNGPGIADASRQKVLQRFCRLEQSRTTPGNGLGLSIVSAIADLHDGTLVLSDNNPGLKVVVTFCNNHL